MGKLFNLKEWLTVADAARHLAIVFGEEVTEADVLRLALDGHLKLSVDFVNGTQARLGKIVPLSEAKMAQGIPLKNGKPCEPYEIALGLKLNDSEIVQFNEKVVSIDGIWDLLMIGNERIDIEFKYYQEISGVVVESINIDGTFVHREWDVICELQTDYDDNKFAAGSRAYLEELKRHIADNEIENDEAGKLLNQHAEHRKIFLEERSSGAAKKYFPAGGLPEDSVLIVRTDALREFEQSINNAQAGKEKPLTTTERNALLTIIATLCDYSAIDPAGRGTAGQIAKLTEEFGATVTDDTIRNVLAKIPGALDARKK